MHVNRWLGIMRQAISLAFGGVGRASARCHSIRRTLLAIPDISYGISRWNGYICYVTCQTAGSRLKYA